MKIHLKQTGGNVLFATLVTTTLIGFYLASYLTMVRTENQFTQRSGTWNMTIPVAEAGVEEALSHLKTIQTNLAFLNRNDWELVDGRYYTLKRWLSTNEYFVVGIFPQNPPVIVSEGFSRPSQRTNFVSRTIMVVTRLNILFPYGMVADKNMRLNGNNIEVDSFDSSDPKYSTNGRYDKSKRKDNGMLVTNSQLTNEFYLGNAKVWGKIASGPGGGFEKRPNLTVGNIAWHAGGNKGVQPGAYTDDANVSLIEIESPITSALIPPPDLLKNYKYVLGSGDYQISAPFKFEGGNVLVTGKARLLVTGDFDFKSTITIQTNASLELYMAGRSASIGGGGIQNNTGVAANFVYYGLPSNENFTFAGNGEFTGCIYAPNAVFTLSGGGSGSSDFSGASVTKQVVMNGQYEFHYDERLGKFGPNSGYLADSWDEINYTWEQIRAQKLNANQLQ
ncbi:MAG: hypothetical protein ABIR24_01815 [Verrucomicrobiota bacterium]